VIDLHTHSVISDGSELPERIPEMAAAAGCSAVALTDHDNLAGLEAARLSADQVGVRLVPGCEVSCVKPQPPPGSGPLTGSVHVLVYFVDDADGPLQRLLAELQNDRFERNHKLVRRLQDLGVDIDYDMVVAEAGGETGLGRPHFAKTLVRIGAAADVDDAFDRWLADGRPGYVPKARITAPEVARLAGESGGVAVLAHPLSLGLELRHLEQVVGDLAEHGLGGIEAFYGRYDVEERKTLRAMAERRGLVATGGSDYHGTFKPDLEVGTGTGDLRVPDEVLEALEARRVLT
jgi:3',5'-nucleoside bisphosphate phosphatase